MTLHENQKDKKIALTRPTLLVLSGFSGAGKTTVRSNILKKIPGSHFSLSVTTRLPRGDEQDGIDYYFTTKEKFNRMIKNNELLEWEEVHGNYYGTPLSRVVTAAGKPGLLIFDIDVYGGLSIKKHYPEAILVFLKAPSLNVLKERLAKRLTDSTETIEQRLQRVPVEEKLSKQYDHVIINNTLDKTINKICEIIRKFQR
ncbi:hypothetical protein AMJ80_02950 [bacterium SM23_31]|nr:MAG: hypothetical protein AMJ80_02950 [bacterium SM23_31]